MEIGDRIKLLRKGKKLSLAKLAKLSDLTSGTISHIETSRNKPTAEVIVKLAKALEVTTDYLLGVEKDTKKYAKIKDKKLFEQFRYLEKLPESKRKILRDFIDKLILGKKEN